jgi:hypothetical protein
MGLSVEKIKFYSVPYVLKVVKRLWLFYLLYPNTYEEGPAQGDEWAGLWWYMVPHATEYGVFAFEVDLSGNYFIVVLCPQTAIEMVLRDMWPEEVVFLLKTAPPVTIEVHKEAVEFLRQWIYAVKKNPKPYIEKSKQFYQCTHLLSACCF